MRALVMTSVVLRRVRNRLHIIIIIIIIDLQRTPVLIVFFKINFLFLVPLSVNFLFVSVHKLSRLLIDF